MKISCMCVTYARVPLLEEAIQCFLDQRYDDAELVIMNSYPQQELSFDHPRIRIINLTERPSSLGALRNLCATECEGEWITIWDDDNHELRNHLRLFAEQMTDDRDWVKMNQMFYAENGVIKNITGAEQNLIAFKAQAWYDIGGYPALNSGEDKVFNDKLRSRPGKIFDLHPPTHIYCWGNGAYHASGGDSETYQQRSNNHVSAEVLKGNIKTGKIRLAPRLRTTLRTQAQCWPV